MRCYTIQQLQLDFANKGNSKPFDFLHVSNCKDCEKISTEFLYRLFNEKYIDEYIVEYVKDNLQQTKREGKNGWIHLEALNESIEEVKSTISIIDVVSKMMLVRSYDRNAVKCFLDSRREDHDIYFYDLKHEFYCFDCNVRGDIFDFIQKKEKCSFIESIYILEKYIENYNEESLSRLKNFARLNSEIQRLYELEDNWDSYDCDKPKLETILLAKELVQLCINEFNIVPLRVCGSVEGGVGVILLCENKDNGRRYADVEFFNEGSYDEKTKDMCGCGIISNPDIDDINVWEIENSSLDFRRSLGIIKEFISTGKMNQTKKEDI